MSFEKFSEYVFAKFTKDPKRHYCLLKGEELPVISINHEFLQSMKFF